MNNFFMDTPYTRFESVETPTIKNPVLGDIDVSDWADEIYIDDNNTTIPIVKPEVLKDKMIYHPEENTGRRIVQSQQPQQEANPQKVVTKNDNEKFVINTLISRLGLSNQQAAGIAGVIMSESGFNPSNFNKYEKEGKLSSSRANGSGYGAGYLQWSMGRKNQALRLIGKENSKIEDLSPEDQVEIIIKELEGPYKNTLEGLRKCKTAKEAAATMYCHNVAGYSSSKNPATQEEIDKINSRYSRFTGQNNLVVDRAMRYAEEYLK